MSSGTQKMSKYSHSHILKAVELLIPHYFEALLWFLCQWTCTVSKMSHYTFIVAVHHKLHPSCSLFACLLTKDLRRSGREGEVFVCEERQKEEGKEFVVASFLIRLRLEHVASMLY